MGSRRSIRILAALLPVLACLFWGVSLPAAYPLVKTVALQDAPLTGETVTVDVNVDLSAGTDQLGTYSFNILWDPAVLEYQSVEGGSTAGFETLNKNESGIDTGTLSVNHFYTTGASGDVNVARLTFSVIGAGGTASAVSVDIQALNAALTFADLTGAVDTSFCTVAVSSYAGPVIESVVIDPNSGTVGPGQVIDITVTAANGQTGLVASDATFLDHQVPLTGQGDGTYTGAYTIAAGDQAQEFDSDALFTENFEQGLDRWYQYGSIGNTDEARYGSAGVMTDVQEAPTTVLQERFSTAYDEFTISYYLKLDSSFTMADGTKTYISMLTGNGGPLYALRIRKEGDTFQLNITLGAFVTDVGPWQTIELGTWNWIKVHYRNASDGIAEWWLNGTGAGQYSGDTSGTPFTIFNALYMGGIQDSMTGELYIDHIQLTAGDHAEPGYPEATNITLTDPVYSLTSDPASSTGSTLVIDQDAGSAPIIASVTIDPGSGTVGIGDTVTITATEASGMTGLTASAAAFNGTSVPLDDQGDGTYQGVYTVDAGDPDTVNAEASGIVLTNAYGSSSAGSSTGSTLSIDANAPAISSVTISPNSGTILVGESITITVAAQSGETGLTPSEAIVNGRSVSLSEAGGGIYEGTYTAQQGDPAGVVLEATGITLTDAAGNVSQAAASSGSTVIIATPALTLLSPNGGEQLAVGSIQPVVWDAANVQTIQIAYSSDNGQSWTVFAESVAGTDGSYQWQVPDVVSTTVLIRVASTADPDLNDISDAVFETISIPSELTHYALGLSNTGVNAILLVPAGSVPEIEGASAEPGDEIAVITPRGRIAGAGVWTGANLAITVWGDDVNEDGVLGFQTGEALSFGIWDASADQEYELAGTYQSGSGTFMPNGVHITASLFTLAAPDYLLPLEAGWNQVSSVYLPGNPALEAVLFPIRQNLIIVKDGAGDVYWPEFAVNQIGDWSHTDGYQIKLTVADTLEIRGSIVAPDEVTYQLDAGWSLISYLGAEGLSPATAFGDISSSIVMVKDAYGMVFWPHYNIDQIRTMSRGMGYWIKLDEAVSFSYPAGSGKIAVERTGLAMPVMFDTPSPTATSATYLLEPDLSDQSTGMLFSDGDEIGVFSSDGICAGAGVWQGDHIAVTVWGDDELTSNTDGLINGERLHMTLWDAETAARYELLTADDVSFEPNAAEVVTVTALGGGHHVSAVPEAFTLLQNFPNPFNPVTTIEYAVPAESRVHLAIYSVSGQQIAVLQDNVQPAGRYSVTWNAEAYPSGVYFCRFRANNAVQTTKLLLLK